MEGDAPLEQRHQQHVVEGLREVDRVPLLGRVDAHDLVAEVLVLAAHVRVGVVDEVVGVLPRLGRRGGVPVPGRGVDLGVVHPVPLAVHDVVADLHVLEDLGRRHRRRPGHPGGLEARGDEQRAPHQGEAAVHRDHRVDVLRVTLAEVVEDLVVDRVELLAERLDLLVGELRERADDPVGIGHVAGLLGWLSVHLCLPPVVWVEVCESRWRWSRAGVARCQRAISTGPSGALTQVRTISPSSPCTSPLRRSRSWPEQSLPMHVWQTPIRQPNGSSAPASSPATRIGWLPSLVASMSLLVNLIVPPSPGPLHHRRRSRAGTARGGGDR